MNSTHQDPIPLDDVLEATGYLSQGSPAAPTVTLARAGGPPIARLPSFGPDAWWGSDNRPDTRDAYQAEPMVYFKSVDDPRRHPIAEWQREIWNRGCTALLWIIAPDRVELYNGLAPPIAPNSTTGSRLDVFHLPRDLAKLDATAGRLAMETGQIWQNIPQLTRETDVGHTLACDLVDLGHTLIETGLSRDRARRLITWSLFVQCLIDRKIVSGHCPQHARESNLEAILRDRTITAKLLEWIPFGGTSDVPDIPDIPDPTSDSEHIKTIVRALEGNRWSGRYPTHPYQFDIIPVELIATALGQLAHACEESTVATSGLRCRPWAGTGQGIPPPIASLVLDQTLNGLTGDETLIDLTCGSGSLLAQALRRLIALQSAQRPERPETIPGRTVIRDTLYKQIHGVDPRPGAIHAASLALYLTALDLDPDPRSPLALEFEPLVGRTLIASDTPTGTPPAAGSKRMHFDIVIADQTSPPTGKHQASHQTREANLKNAFKAAEYAHERTRLGLILDAAPFFNHQSPTIETARQLVEMLGPTTLVDLSELSWLYPERYIVTLLARCHQRTDWMTLAQALWSSDGGKNQIIEIPANDVETLPIASWRRNPGLLRATFTGTHKDRLLLDDLWERHRPLDELDKLDELDEKLATPETHARPDGQPRYELRLTGGRTQGKQRLAATVHEHGTTQPHEDLGIHLMVGRYETATLLSGIMQSALTTWYTLMTDPNIDPRTRPPQWTDIAKLPIPTLDTDAGSHAADEIRTLARRIDDSHGAPRDDTWEALDEAVFDLYALDPEERATMRDGMIRARWRHSTGRMNAVAPAGPHNLEHYAKAFLSTMDNWLSASGKRRLRGEIIDSRHDDPLRIVRFVLEAIPGPGPLETIQTNATSRSILEQLAEQMQSPVMADLIGSRELRLHTREQITIVKPAARRHWLAVNGLNDAMAVIKESAHG